MSKNTELLERRRAAVPRGVANATPVFAERALNSELWDKDGRRFIDFAGGIGVLNTGHCHPKVIAAATKQMASFTHTSFQVVPYEPYIELAERLNALAPFRPGQVDPLHHRRGSSREYHPHRAAGYRAFRCRRLYGRLPRPHAADGGNDRQGQSLQEGPRPDAAGCFPHPLPDQHQGVSVADYCAGSICCSRPTSIPSAAPRSSSNRCRAGDYIAPKELLVALREICDRHGILLIADEVQCGFARTGKMFAIEHSGVAPDLVATAKSLAGGFPLSGVIGRAEIMDKPEPGAMGGTYGGNPIACAAALAVLDVIAEEKLLARSEALGARIKQRLEEIARGNSSIPIGAIRGLGGMVAFEISRRRAASSRTP